MLATHSGKFHADEALAVYLLRKLPEYATMPLVRTRDPAVIATATIVVDVGAVYDPPTHRYDHHQRSFTDCWPGRKIRLSSAGLVYKHFGSRIIDQALLQKSLDTPTSVILERVYDQLIMAFDGVDNGVPQYETSAPPAYKSSTSISDRVERLNPDWNQVCTEQETLALFEQAVALTGIEFEHAVQQY